MHKIIHEVDRIVLIAKYKLEEDEEITEKNEVGVRVQAKNAWMNYAEVIPKYLWQIHKYLLNRRLNRKRIFSKFRLTHNIPIENIIMTLKEALVNIKFCAKTQAIQY